MTITAKRSIEIIDKFNYSGVLECTQQELKEIIHHHEQLLESAFYIPDMRIVVSHCISELNRLKIIHAAREARKDGDIQ